MKLTVPYMTAAALIAIAFIGCAAPPMTGQPTSLEGYEASCTHGRWDGPDDDWASYAVLSSGYVREQPTLFEPPTVQMVLEDGAGATYVEGALYFADWVTKRRRMTVEPIEPAPWPVPLAGPPCHVRVLTDVMPNWVSVSGTPADAIDPETGVPPDETAVVWYECGRFGDRPCVHLNDDGLVELRPIPAALLDLPYITVFASWSVALEDRDDSPSAPASVSASWLFRFAER